ncbi:MAG: LLM class F420-dependent oxidoreductase [Rhodospirillales bacterium]|nr:LLM class F420-dependent oxidoreductase [Rhodospirillales bacterium]
MQGRKHAMQIGFNAPTAGALYGVEDLTRIVVGGEGLGYDYATFSDHVVIPTDIHATYPYSATGEFPSGSRGGRHEQLTEMAYVAGMTRKLRLVSSVMVVPHRPAVLTAKILSTIDVLSGGRLVLGIGAGWLKEEFEAIQAPDFEARGKVTDEYIAAFKELWTNDDPTFAGEHVKFDKIVFAPKPVQKPHPPIWVGGESGPALRRTAKLGDAWYPIGTNPANPLDSLKRFKTQVARLRKMTAEAGRDPGAVGLTLRVTAYGEGVPALAGDGERRLFAGKPAEIAADIRALRDAGVGCLDFGVPGNTADEVLGNMAKLRAEVLALV